MDMISVQNWYEMLEQDIKFARAFALVGDVDEAIHSVDLADTCLSRIIEERFDPDPTLWEMGRELAVLGYWSEFIRLCVEVPLDAVTREVPQ